MVAAVTTGLQTIVYRDGARVLVGQHNLRVAGRLGGLTDAAQ